MLKIAVVGAGVFGGWTALELSRRGARVTVVDAWGPGNVRSSSGGETRVIRAGYGSRTHYTSLAIRSLRHWRELDQRTGRRVFHQTGVLWMFDRSDEARAFAAASASTLRAGGSPIEELTPRHAQHRYPQIDFNGIAAILFEPGGGYLMARRACEDVVEQVRSEGGTYRLAAVMSPVEVGAATRGLLRLTDGSAIEADVFVLACGPWLGSLLPDVVGRRVIATRQEVFYFGPPAGDMRFAETQLPAWIELGARPIYGIPGNAGRGFKVADDSPGAEMDPTTADRDVTASAVDAARTFVARRFPALAAAPLVGSEVCQYEATPDSELILDRHPQAENIWIAGGGSGHGFKLGPAVGELIADAVLGRTAIDPRFALARFDAAAAFPAKWV